MASNTPKTLIGNEQCQSQSACRRECCDKEALLPSGMRYHIVEIEKVHTGGGKYDYYVTMLATNRRLD